MNSERPILNGSGQIFASKESISQSFESLKGAKERVGKPLAEDLAKIATERTYDALTTLRVLDNATGWLAFGDGRQRVYGELIASGIDQYFQRLVFCHKSLFSDNLNIEVKIQEATNLVSRVLQNYRIANARNYSMPESIAEFIVNVSNALENHIESARSGRKIVLGITRDRSLRYSFNKDAFIDLFEAVGHLKETQNTKDLEVVTQLLYLLHEKNEGALPDYLVKNFDGVNLKEVIEETDQEEFNQKTLRLISGMDTGDLFLQELVGVIFFHLDSSPGTSDEVNAYLERMYGFQRWLAAKLIMPALGTEEDREFDHMFTRVIARLDKENLGIIGSVVHGNILFDSWRINRSGLRGLESFNDPERFPYQNLVLDEYKKRHSGNNFLFERVMEEFFYERWNDIEQNMRERFGMGVIPVISEIEERLQSFNYQMVQTEIFKANLCALNAAGSLERLRRDASEIDVLKMGFMRVLDFKKQLEDDLPGGQQTVHFSKDSVPRGYAVSGVTLSKLDNGEKGINFLLHSQSLHLALDGLLDENGEIVEFSVNMDESLEGLKKLFELIVVVSYGEVLSNLGRITNEPVALTQMKKFLRMEDMIKLDLSTEENIEREAMNFYRSYRGLSHQLLRRLLWGDLDNAIVHRYPGGMSALKEKLGITGRVQNSVTPELADIGLAMYFQES